MKGNPHGHRWSQCSDHIVMPQYQCLNVGCDFNDRLVTTLPSTVHSDCGGHQ